MSCIMSTDYCILYCLYIIYACMFVCTCSYRGPNGRLAMPNESSSLNKDVHFTSLDSTQVRQQLHKVSNRNTDFLVCAYFFQEYIFCRFYYRNDREQNGTFTEMCEAL